MSYINSSLLQCFREDYSRTSKNNVLGCHCEVHLKTFLNGATMSLSHRLSLITAGRLFIVLLAFVASIISFNVIAREQPVWLQS